MNFIIYKKPYHSDKIIKMVEVNYETAKQALWEYALSRGHVVHNTHNIKVAGKSKKAIALPSGWHFATFIPKRERKL
jgi:hypothetical protein